MTIEELIEHCERATGPDRWLDAKIDAAMRIGSEKMRGGGYEWAWENFPVWAHHKQARGMCGVQHSNGDLGLVWDSPAFTASVDAAIALAERVQRGWRIITEHGDNYSLVQFKRGWGVRAEILGVATVERADDLIALALSEAILRANTEKSAHAGGGE